MKQSDFSRLELDNMSCLDHHEDVEMSLAEARFLVEALPDEADELSTAMDRAQGEVHQGNAEAYYVVIKIVR